MKIVVCIKRVPATTNVKLDPVTNQLKREGVKSVINPFDLYALELGVEFYEKYGGEIIALSMGVKNAEASLREALACGATNAILLTDFQFGGSDTWATSYILASAIKKIGNVDLIICGKQAIDGDTAQVGPGIAAHLNLQQAINVSYTKRVIKNKIEVIRQCESGYDIAEISLPAVLSVIKGINRPRIPTLKNVLKSLNIPIEIWGKDDLDLDLTKIGLKGSPTKVVKSSPPDIDKKDTIVFNQNPENSAENLLLELRKRLLI